MRSAVTNHGQEPGGAGAGRAAAEPVLLLHGFASSPRVMAAMAVHLRRSLARPVLCWEISPGRQDLRATAADLERRLAQLTLPAGRAAVDVVAHSMGGLVASYWLKRIDRGRRIRRVITLGTPHRGVPLARAGAWLLGHALPALRQMCPGSPLLQEIASLRVPPGSQLVSIAGAEDRLVRGPCARVPESPGQHNLSLPGANHWSLLFCETALDAVGDALSESPPQRALAA